MKRVVWALLGMVLLSGWAVADMPPGYKLVLQTENFPPYNFATNGGNYAKESDADGISIRIVQEIFKRSGIDYSITLKFPWDRIYNKAKDKSGYGVFSMVRNDEREALFKWVGPLAPDEWVFFAREDSEIQLTALQGAKNYTVGGYKGDALTEYLQGEGLQVEAAAADHLNAKKLQDGKIDLWAANSFSGLFLANQQGVTGIKQVLTFDKVDLYLGLNKETPDGVVNALQAALDSMREDGMLETIITGYLK